MAEPKNKFLAIVITPDGQPAGSPKYFPTRNDARDGAKEMIRTAPQDHSVYLFEAFASLEATVTYDLKTLGNGAR